MRTPEEIREEIQKVKKAQNTARQKIIRCDARLDELAAELKEAESKSA